MKKFKELKPGDKIYYWDKGKLHEQIVNKCEIIEKEYCYEDWEGTTIISRYKVLVIQAGKSKEYSLRYVENNNTCSWGGMKRFADYESAINWMSEQKNCYIRKINKYQRKIDKYSKLIKKYIYE